MVRQTELGGILYVYIKVYMYIHTALKIAKLKIHHYILMSNLQNLMLAKVPCYTVYMTVLILLLFYIFVVTFLFSVLLTKHHLFVSFSLMQDPKIDYWMFLRYILFTTLTFASWYLMASYNSSIRIYISINNVYHAYNM